MRRVKKKHTKKRDRRHRTARGWRAAAPGRTLATLDWKAAFRKLKCNLYAPRVLGYFYHVDAEAPGRVSFKIRCNYCSSFIIQRYLCIILMPFLIPGMLFTSRVSVSSRQADIVAGITFTRRRSRRRWRPAVSTRFTGRRELLRTVHYVRRRGNKTRTIKRPPRRDSPHLPLTGFTCRL